MIIEAVIRIINDDRRGLSKFKRLHLGQADGRRGGTR